jgi:hypothetical protein
MSAVDNLAQTTAQLLGRIAYISGVGVCHDGKEDYLASTVAMDNFLVHHPKLASVVWPSEHAEEDDFKLLAERYKKRLQQREVALLVLDYMEQIEIGSQGAIRFFEGALDVLFPKSTRTVEELPDELAELGNVGVDPDRESVVGFLEKCLAEDLIPKATVGAVSPACLQRRPLTKDFLHELATHDEGLSKPGSESLQALTPERLDCDRDRAAQIGTASLIKELLRRKLTDQERELVIDGLLSTPGDDRFLMIGRIGVSALREPIMEMVD